MRILWMWIRMAVSVLALARARARFVLVGRHLAILVENVRRLHKVSVVVAERGERSLDRLAIFVEAVIQVASAAGDAGLYSLEVALAGGGDLRERRKLDRESKIYSSQLSCSPRAMEDWRQVIDVGQWGFVTIFVYFVEGLRDVVAEFCTCNGGQQHDPNNCT